MIKESPAVKKFLDAMMHAWDRLPERSRRRAYRNLLRGQFAFLAERSAIRDKLAKVQLQLLKIHGRA